MKRMIDTRLTDTHQKLISALVFFVSFAFLWRFIDLFRNTVPQSFIIFWLVTLGIFIPLLYQIFRFGHDREWEGFIIFQIILVIYFFIIIEPVLTDNTFFLGDDEYTLMKCIEYVRDGGRDFLFMGGPDYGRWPFNHIFMLNISLVTGLELFSAAYWLPSIISTLGLIFVYLLARTVYHDHRAALLALLASGCFYISARSHNSLHPEYLGIIFIFACLYLYFKRLQYAESAIKCAFLAILVMFALPFTNITSSTMMAFFFMTLLVTSLIVAFTKSQHQNLTINYTSVATFVCLTLVVSVVYWVYVSGPLFERYVELFTELRAPVYYPHEEAAIAGTEPYIFRSTGLREDISGWGQPAYAVIFGIIMLYEVIRNRKCEYWGFDTLFTLWAGVGLFLVLFTGLFPIAKYSASHMGNRVQSFVYPFMLMAAAHVGFRLKSQLKQALFCLLILGFLLVNVASWHFVPSNIFAQTFHPTEFGDNQQEWVMMDRVFEMVTGPTTTALSYGTAHYFRYRTGGMPYIFADVFENNLLPLKERKFDLLATRSEKPYFLAPFPRRAPIPVPLDEATLALISNTPWLEKVYDNQEWVIYRVIR